MGSIISSLICRDVGSGLDLEKLLLSLSVLRRLPTEIVRIIVLYVGLFPIRGKHVLTLKTGSEYTALDGSPTAKEIFTLDEGYHGLKVRAIGLGDYSIRRSWRGCGSDVPGRKYYPHGLCVDPKTGNIFVADRRNNIVREMTNTGEVVQTFAFDWFNGPLALTIDPLRRHLYVTNTWGDIHLSVISLETGQPVGHTTLLGVLCLDSVFFDVSSRILVAVDREAHQVILFDTVKRVVVRRFWCDPFFRPCSAIISAGEVLVADSGNDRIQVFSLDMLVDGYVGQVLRDVKPIYTFTHFKMFRPTCMYRDTSTGYLYITSGELRKSILVFE